VLELLWFALIGVAAGWLAGQISKGSGFGLLGDLAVGVVGSFVGGFLFGLVGLGDGVIARLLMAVVGAVVLLYVIRVVRRA